MAPRNATFYDAPEALCSVEGCAKPARARGMCKAHYARVWRRVKLWKHTTPAAHTIPAGVNPLVAELYGILNAQGKTVDWMAERAGVAHNTITAWRKQNMPQLATYEACVNVLGYDLKLVKRE